MSSDTRLFGRYQELVLLLLGFLLTTLLGGYLAQSWQNRAHAFEREVAHRRSEQQAATQLFEELSRLMDKRLYRMRRLHTGMADPSARGDMKNRWGAYRDTLFEWNENLNRNLALTQRYFGDEARQALELEINEGFRELGTLLEGGAYPNNGLTKYEHRQRVADRLNNLIYNFDIQLIEAIQSGEVGHFMEKSG